MIVRINQIDISRIDADGGWPAETYAGAIQGNWPADARAFELQILSQDEKQQPLTDDFRQQQLRQMIPQAAIALTTGDRPAGSASEAPIVLRLDGKIAAEELLPVWGMLTEPDGSGQYGFGPTVKIAAEPTDAWGSVRIVPSWKRLASACADTSIGLESSVRLRLMAIPTLFVPELVDVSSIDDPRWEHLLSECQFYLGTTPGLTALQLVVRRMEAAQVKSRVMQRLIAVARGEPAIPD
ncbi:hypothetical protein [Humisphaera borealis]|uniref:Uncharacterized protein n=1 Tax=Humisphaera borealis TaxID=2807512 RepID=A0A7M2WT56_9BACT|nr:hypothetical protein [Humisphaera borealis]QOV88613.1 hypothetical protein IPV69_20580 [Humisphaera borealis]